MVYQLNKKVMTSLTLAGSLLLGSHSAHAEAVQPEEGSKTASDMEKERKVVQKVPVEQQAPQKMEFHVISSGIRMHMGADSGVSGSPSKASSDVHVVKKGETLGEIADAHGLSLKGLLRMNPQIKDPNRIYIRDQIQVKGRSVQKDDPASAKGSVEDSKGKTTLSGEDRGGEKGSGIADAIIGKARSLLNATYRYGAEGPNSFDCSGFTKFVFQQQGYSLPRTSAAQSGYGTAVSRGDLRKGDLVFFRTGGGGISHVAIYMGGGKMIHATNPREDVTVSSLNERYWSERYAGARRVIR